MSTRRVIAGRAGIVPLVGGVLLIDSVFYAAVVPILGRLARDFSLSKADAGLLVGAYAIGMIASTYPSARAAARWGGRPCVIAGLAGMAVGCVGVAFGDSMGVLLVARLVQGLGGTLSWTGGLVWLAQAARDGERAKMVGTALGIGTFGSQFGPVVGALASAIGRAPAFSLGVLAGGVLGLWAWSRPDTQQRALPATAPVRQIASADFCAGFWLTVLASAGIGVIDVLTPLQLFRQGVGPGAIGAVFFVASGLLTVVSRLTGVTIDRRGIARPVLLAFAGGLLALAVLVASAVNAVTMIATILGVASLGALWGPGTHLISRSATRHQVDQSFAFGAFLLAWALGFAIGSDFGGALAEVGGRGLPYLITAGLCVATVAAGPVRRACLGESTWRAWCRSDDLHTRAQAAAHSCDPCPLAAELDLRHAPHDSHALGVASNPGPFLLGPDATSAGRADPAPPSRSPAPGIVWDVRRPRASELDPDGDGR